MELRRNKYFRSLVLMLAVYGFLVSIQTMSAGFKGLGADFSDGLIAGTQNPLVGLFIGILATSVIQSSSATTSIVVALVAAEPAFLPNAVPIIMGANIGTSVTNLIVSIGHMGRAAELRRAFAAALVHDIFNIIAVCIFFPLELITRAITGTGLIQGLATSMANGMGGVEGVKFLSPIKTITDPVTDAIMGVSEPHAWIAIAIALLILFMALKFLVDSLKWLAETRMQKVLDKYLFGSAMASFAFGVGLTVLVQSSSITTSFMVPLVGGGLLSIEQIFPFTLGANIGTTVTAMLAALATTSTAAVTIALCHFLFNVFGTAVIYPFKKVPIEISRKIGDYVSENKKFAIIYIIVVFYVIPGIVILLSGVI
ncbi:MAG: Na/Pi symporter [Candidatus Thermoplasmatota archaeon]|nr:Na/Pi symporter [Candidatus Thermoplasmatota archaeon]